MLKTQETKRSFVAMVFAIICLIPLIWRFIDFLHLTVQDTVVTLIFEIIALALLTVFAVKNKISFLDFGVKISNPKKTFSESLIISAVLIAIGIIGKIVIMKVKPDFFPPDAPFFRWRSRSILGYFYIITAFVQEFLARGFLQKGLDELYEGKGKALTVMVLCALVFSVFHIHKGFVGMLAAGFLTAVLGVLYERHQNIWGVSIVHYLVGYTYVHLFIAA